MPMTGMTIALLSASFFWLVSIYQDSLRDPRFMDGWVLACGMWWQFCFHIALRSGRLSPGVARRWRTAHIFTGCLIVAAFLSHVAASLPDTAFEWLIWLSFILITLSGLWRTYLTSATSIAATSPAMTWGRIREKREKLSLELETLVNAAPPQSVTALPVHPETNWVKELHRNHLKDYFSRISPPTSVSASHDIIISEIEAIDPFSTPATKEKLRIIKRLTNEKQQLDIALRNLLLSSISLVLHVHATYAMIALGTMHVVIMYSFSSGSR